MSFIALNHNSVAASAASGLLAHSQALAVSTRRLSSGLRINSAADDAAGLAIRELMRSDIAALRQGMRNVNDAISLIQTADGALGVIDEKLIRMKELAEQAATGTYDSTQRQMIHEEWLAMGEEINRIARATDFNGIKLLNGAFERQTVQVTGPDDKQYDWPKGEVAGTTLSIWPGATATQQGGWKLDLQDPGALVGTNNVTVTNLNIPKIGDNYLLVTPTNQSTNIPPGSTVELSFTYYGEGGGQVFGIWTVGIDGATPTDGNGNGHAFTWNEPNGGPIHIQTELVDAKGGSASMRADGTATWTAPADTPAFSSTIGTVTGNLSADGSTLDLTVNLVGSGNTATSSWKLTYGNNVTEASTALASASFVFEVKDVTPKPDDPEPEPAIPDNVVRIHFGTGNESAEDYYDIRKHDATLKGLGLEGVGIQTQDQAQQALTTVNDAIVAKDRIRAEYGAMQNRLENTMTSLNIQAENLQAAESRLSDADIAAEMSSFVRSQILTRSAIAMLAQANSLPQMVMSLLQ